MKGFYLVPLGLALLAGCHLGQKKPPPPPTFSEYHAPGFDPNVLTRVLLMPLANESGYLNAGEEIRVALAAELQSQARFEVVMAPPNPELTNAQLVHLHGRFNEAAMVALARTFKVDGIIMGALTQYHPYAPPRIGLSLQMVSPSEAVVVASVDGLWDARNKRIADEAKGYYHQTNHPYLLISRETDLALTSPQLYQRFVCHQVAASLANPPPPAPPGADGAAQGSNSGAEEKTANGSPKPPAAKKEAGGPKAEPPTPTPAKPQPATPRPPTAENPPPADGLGPRLANWITKPGKD